MPTILPRIKTLTQLDNHTVELQTKNNRALAIWNNLSTYDYDPASATHPMPNFTWNIPTNQAVIEYNSGYSEMYYNGTAYSGLTTAQKQQFWQWIDKFIVQAMKNYDKTYGF